MKRYAPFTLVEILAVVALIGILAGIAVGVSGLVMRKTAEAKTQAAVKMLELAINQYYQKYGHFPEAKGFVSRIAVDVTASVKGSLWEFLDEKYLKSNTIVNDGHRYAVDAWDVPLFYRVPGYYNKDGFDLGSAGPDKKFGDGKGNELVISDDPEDADFKKDAGNGDDIVNFIRKK